MKILFSPSESKNQAKGSENVGNFIFPNLNDKRKFVLEIYEKYINSLNIDELSQFFGLKDKNLINHYKSSFKEKNGIKAILRYNGVAYKSLDYKNLENKYYIDKNVLIFSNLFGIIKANDILPDYKLKQGAKLPNLNIEKFYKDNFSSSLDEYLKDDEILDLRASFYERFYTIKKPFFTLKFIKNGKVVSHYAKYYRGLILKEMAKNNIESVDEFKNININELILSEIQEIKNKQEFIFEIKN